MKPVSALQAALAGEHAAVYLYGVMGGQVSRSEHPDLARLITTFFDVHVTRRDRLTVLIHAHGESPVPSETAYRLPNAIANPSQLRAAARQIEHRSQFLYGQVVGSADDADRAWAISTLISAATQGLDLGIAPTDYPGMDI